MIVLSGTGRIADVAALADRLDQVSVSPKVIEASWMWASPKDGVAHQRRRRR